MSVPATQIFDFLERQSSWAIDRREIAFQPFGRLRRNLWKIIFRLGECEDEHSNSILDELRPLISEWLTVPVPFDQAVLESLLAVMGPPRPVEQRWGLDIRNAYHEVIAAAREMCLIESPMRTALRGIIEELKRSGPSFKIFCHHRAQQHFESLFSGSTESPFSSKSFLHSVRDYGETPPFDCLIKVGPLRSLGWGFAPDAIITAPRFGRLIHVVWSGSKDQSDFGYDPTSNPRANAEEHRPGETYTTGRIRWEYRETRSGDDSESAADLTAIDELQCFQEFRPGTERRAATLIHLDRERTILYPPNARILSFDPRLTGRDQVGHRVPSADLSEGMFLIRPILHDLDLGEGGMDATSTTTLWKMRLQQQLQKNPAALIRELREAGISLVGLASATQRWSEFSSAVIPAPQRVDHFATLINVLGLSNERRDPNGKLVPFTQLAWMEIRRSRGEAIQAGFVEKEIVEELLIEILRALLSTIAAQATEENTFRIHIPANSSIQGSLVFHRIVAIEDGFRAPDSEMKILHDEQTVDKWRD